VDGKGTEHHPFLDANLSDFLADIVQEKELHRIMNGFIFEPLNLSVQMRKGVAHGLGADFFAVKLLGNNSFEFAGADSILQQPADDCINVSWAALMALKH